MMQTDGCEGGSRILWMRVEEPGEARLGGAVSLGMVV